MRSAVLFEIPLRQAAITMLALGRLLAWTAQVSTQGFGVGGRLAWVTSDDNTNNDSVRLRRWPDPASSPSTLESRSRMDRHSESFELLNQKVTETPNSGVAPPVRLAPAAAFLPFLLGSPGWVSAARIEPMDRVPNLSVEHDP